MVTTLNQRARADLILAGQVDARAEVRLHDHTEASVGDAIITRRNDRELRIGRGWVRNGSRWTITAIDADGSLRVRPAGRRWGATLRLPAEYVAEHVQLGYAVTAYRAQGVTVDTGHTLIEPGATRENFYVAMTRGRLVNTAYVSINRPDDDHIHPPTQDTKAVAARKVLAGVLQHVGAELSARQMIAAEQDAWGSVGQLAAEYETIAAAAQQQRWEALVRATRLTEAEADAAIGSTAFGVLGAELRRAEADGYDTERLLHALVASRPLDDAEDVAAVLHERVIRALARANGAGRVRQPAAPIAGLITPALGTMDDDMRAALRERAALIEQRPTRSSPKRSRRPRHGPRNSARSPPIRSLPRFGDARRAPSRPTATPTASRRPARSDSSATTRGSTQMPREHAPRSTAHGSSRHAQQNGVHGHRGRGIRATSVVALPCVRGRAYPECRGSSHDF